MDTLKNRKDSSFRNDRFARPKSAAKRRGLSDLMQRGRPRQLCIAVLLCASMNLSNAQAPDSERGQMLYENHCKACHTPKIHERANKAPLDKAQLRAIVDGWRREEGLPWTAQDTEDVVEYVSRMRNKRLQE